MGTHRYINMSGLCPREHLIHASGLTLSTNVCKCLQGLRLTVVAAAGNRAETLEGDKGEACPLLLGPCNALPAFASSSREKTCSTAGRSPSAARECECEGPTRRV